MTTKKPGPHTLRDTFPQYAILPSLSFAMLIWLSASTLEETNIILSLDTGGLSHADTI